MAGNFAIEDILTRISQQIGNDGVPSVTELARREHAPFEILVSTILSARTKDQTTMSAFSKLFEVIGSPAELASLEETRIAELIYPVGFYQNKAKSLKKLGRVLVQNFQSRVPDNLTDLLSLPGVGIKTANLVLGLAFNIPAICVDTHVHRIMNRLGYVRTITPTQTEEALRKTLPRSWWIPVNTVLVRFGQLVCRPTSPRCTQCSVEPLCQKVTVMTHR